MSISPNPGIVDYGNGPRSIVFSIAEASGITPGVKGQIVIPFYGVITSWSIVGSPSGSAVVDVWKRPGAIPTVTHTICAGQKPSISGAQLASADVPEPWLGEVAVNDVMVVNLDSVSGFTSLTIQINCGT